MKCKRKKNMPCPSKKQDSHCEATLLPTEPPCCQNQKMIEERVQPGEVSGGGGVGGACTKWTGSVTYSKISNDVRSGPAL